MGKKQSIGRAILVLVLFASAFVFPRVSFAAIILSSDYAVPSDDAFHDIPGLSSSFFLGAGQSVYVYAKGTATSNTNVNFLQGLKVVCDSNYVNSTRNHTGNDSYVSNSGKLTVSVRFLFSAPLAGSYSCKFQVRASPGSGALTTSRLALKAGVDSGAAVWGTENDPKDADYSSGLDTGAIHLGPGLAAGTNEFAVRSSRWLASSSSVGIDVSGDVELTSCYYGTSSCAAYAYGPSASYHNGSVVDTRLLVQQMPSLTSPTPCAVTYDPPSGYLRTSITSDTHHQKIYHAISNVPFSAACGNSRYFVNKLEVKWISDNPIRIEPGSPAGGYSLGTARNR
jgi:hypothetical protein